MNLRKFIATLVIGLALLFAENACSEQGSKDPKPTAEKTREPGPVAPEDRPARPREGREGLEGCPTNTGIVVDVYHGIITESKSENRIGAEAVFVLRWVNDRDHPSGNGGCWQQTAFTDPSAMDRFADCQPGDPWTACAKD